MKTITIIGMLRPYFHYHYDIDRVYVSIYNIGQILTVGIYLSKAPLSKQFDKLELFQSVLPHRFVRRASAVAEGPWGDGGRGFTCC